MRRFEAVIADPRRAADPMNRPHVRFDGENLAELGGRWPHAQNDALGYFLWLYCLMANENALRIEDGEAEVLSRFPRYLRAIRYWEDEDSGHWEEVRKVSASSIGAVVGGLRELKRLSASQRRGTVLERLVASERLDKLLDGLLAEGTRALRDILPSECVQPGPKQLRRFDAALLFLVYPLRVVEGELAETIVRDVIGNLQGEYGIRGYLGDSFWCADYKQVPKELRTADYSNDIASRDALLAPGGEAQWCLFDPVLSAYFAVKYQQTRAVADLNRQTEYFNRALGQVTGPDCPFGEFKCPELYYREQGRIETSDVTPLLWTQANLWTAVPALERSLPLAAGQPPADAPDPSFCGAAHVPCCKWSITSTSWLRISHSALVVFHLAAVVVDDVEDIDDLIEVRGDFGPLDRQAQLEELAGNGVQQATRAPRSNASISTWTASCRIAPSGLICSSPDPVPKQAGRTRARGSRCRRAKRCRRSRSPAGSMWKTAPAT